MHRHFSKEDRKNGQYAYEKILNIISQQGHASQNHSEHSEKHFTPSRVAVIKRIMTRDGEDVEHWNLLTLLVGM